MSGVLKKWRAINMDTASLGQLIRADDAMAGELEKARGVYDILTFASELKSDLRRGVFIKAITEDEEWAVIALRTWRTNQLNQANAVR